MVVTADSDALVPVVSELREIPEFDVEVVSTDADGSLPEMSDTVDCVLLSDEFDETELTTLVGQARQRWPGAPVVLVVTDVKNASPDESVLSEVDDCLTDAVSGTSRSILRHSILGTIDKMRSQMNLHRHRTLLRQTQEIANIGGWEYHCDQNTLRWTEQVYRIHELPLEYEPTVAEALGFYHQKDRPDIEAKFEALVEAGTPFNLQVRIVTAAGNVRWVRARGDAELSEGQVHTARGTIQDITALVEQRSETHKLRENLREERERLRRLASVLSHELRNPLMAIDGQLQLYRDRGETAHLDAAEQNVERLGDVITDTLWLVRGDDTVSEMSMVDVMSVAEEAWATFNDDTVSLHTTSMERIPANRSLLQTVFEKLFENTLEHTSATELSVGPYYMGDYLEGFYIEDNGSGFTEAELSAAFDIGIDETSGTSGIGLAVVKEIIQRHNWTISVVEGDGDGAKFEIQTGML